MAKAFVSRCSIVNATGIKPNNVEILILCRCGSLDHFYESKIPRTRGNTLGDATHIKKRRVIWGVKNLLEAFPLLENFVDTRTSRPPWRMSVSRLCTLASARFRTAPGLTNTAPPYLGSVTGTTAGSLIIASATCSSSWEVRFQSIGTSRRAHWYRPKHGAYESCFDGVIWSHRLG